MYSSKYRVQDSQNVYIARILTFIICECSISQFKTATLGRSCVYVTLSSFCGVFFFFSNSKTTLKITNPLTHLHTDIPHDLSAGLQHTIYCTDLCQLAKVVITDNNIEYNNRE